MTVATNQTRTGIPNREALSADEDYFADRAGVASCVAAFQAATAELSSRGGGKFKIRRGTYLFTVAGDADTILIPSNVEIECEPGVIFKWGYWGSPLFAIVNKTNVTLKLNGAKFQWAGTFGSTSGTSDKFSYGRAIPAYEWCAHVAVMGSEFVRIDGGRCAGNTTSNVQNAFISFRGTSAGGLTEGNQFTNTTVDDVCQGLVGSEQKRFLIDGVFSDRYSNASNALYGPGHVIYITGGTAASANGVIRNVMDNAGTAISSFTDGSHSVSLKYLTNSEVTGIMSRRPEGVLNFDTLDNVKMEVRYRSDDTNDAVGSGSVYGVNPTFGALVNKHLKIKAEVIHEAQRDMPPVNLGAIGSGAKNLYCELEAFVVRACDGTETSPAVYWAGSFGTAKITQQNTGSGTTKTAIAVDRTSEDNNFYIRSLGAVPNPRVTLGANGTQSRNTFWLSGDSTIDYDTNEFTPSNGNAVIWEGARQYQSSKTIGVTTDPGATFQLPKPGAYFVHLNMAASGANHARAGLYWVVFDDASVNDFTAAQLIGAQITKGVSAPSVLGLAVNKDGLCTVTSTAGSDTWSLVYGYRQLSAAGAA